MAAVVRARAGWLLIAVFVGLTLVVLTLGYLYQRHLRDEAEADKVAELSAVADLKRDQIVAWMLERRADARALGDSQSFAAAAARVLAGEVGGDDAEVVAQGLSLLLESYRLRAALLLDLDGGVRMAVGADADVARSAELDRAVATATADLQTTTSELYRIGPDGPVYSDVAAPLRLRGQVVGAVALRSAADDFLFPLIQNWPLPSASAESLLVRRDGDDVLFLNTLRHDDHSALTLRIPITDEALPATVALTRGDGVVQGPDYRGVAVVAALRRVPGTPWALVAKIDRAELFAPVGRTVTAIATVVGLLIAGAALAVGLVWRTQRLGEVRRQLEAERTLSAARAALNEQEELFETVFEASAVGKTLTTPSGKLLRVNQAFAEMLGHSAEEMQQLDVATITHPDDVVASHECIRCLLAGESEDYHLEKRYLHRDGRGIWASVNVRVVRDESSVPRFFVTSAENITERVEMAGELAQSVAALKRSNEDLERFAYVASHDLQEPLRMVVSYMDLLVRRYGDRLDGDARDFIDFAVGGARRMQRMINDLLAYSRVNMRGERLRPVDLGRVAEEVVAELGAAAVEIGATVEVGPLPTVVGDASQLAMVLRNLIGNGLKFHGADAPAVRVSAVAGDGMWTIAVNDNGIGIEPQHYERAFVVFQRLNTQARFPGSGIGLSVAKRIVERHGGRIWVESQAGTGSTFFFTLVAATAVSNGDQADDIGS